MADYFIWIKIYYNVCICSFLSGISRLLSSKWRFGVLGCFPCSTWCCGTLWPTHRCVSVCVSVCVCARACVQGPLSSLSAGQPHGKHSQKIIIVNFKLKLQFEHWKSLFCVNLMLFILFSCELWLELGSHLLLAKAKGVLHGDILGSQFAEWWLGWPWSEWHRTRY